MLEPSKTKPHFPWLSCAVARLVMNMWDRELKTILDTNKLQLEEVFRYLDDWLGFMLALKAGWRWDRGQLRFRQERGGQQTERC